MPRPLTDVRGDGNLVVGQVVKYEDRLWRVGLRNPSRARLDPLTGSVTVVDSTSGRAFNSFGSSVNIAPGSFLEALDPEKVLDGTALARYIRMEEEAVSERMDDIQAALDFETNRQPVASDFSDNSLTAPMDQFEEVEYMANGVAAMPTGGLKSKNKARLAKLKAKKSAAPSGRTKSAPKVPKPCHCGCGEQTGGHFAPGHDARFKGLLLKIERGEADVNVLKKSVRDSYQWVKSGRKGKDGTVGMRPTRNYKGEPHKGYLLD